MTVEFYGLPHPHPSDHPVMRGKFGTQQWTYGLFFQSKSHHLIQHTDTESCEIGPHFQYCSL